MYILQNIHKHYLFIQYNMATKKQVVGKTFRLFDFDIYDEKLSVIQNETQESNDDENSVASGGEKPPAEMRQFIIQMFGLNDKGETCSIYVTDYKPFFYAKVSDAWTQSTVSAFVREIASTIGTYHIKGLESALLEEHNQLYGFSAGKKYKFIKFVFHNMATFNKFKSVWYEVTTNHNPDAKYNNTRKLRKYRFQNMLVEIYESTIPPLLRFFHIQNISPSGWVLIQTSHATIPANKSSFCQYEYICNLKHIRAMPQKETPVPYKICSFDIEASSSHGDFPLPVKSYKRLAMNMIDVYIRQFKQLTNATTAMLDKYIQKMVLAAFGIGACNDIDLVFPKNPIGKTDVQSRIDILLHTPIEQLRDYENVDGNVTELLTIIKMFDKMASDIDAAAQQQRAGGDGTMDGDDDDDDNEGEDAEVEIEAKPTTFVTTSAMAKHQFHTDTVSHLFLSGQFDRDQKIAILDELLTRIFPALKGDEVTCIGSTFMTYGAKDTYLNHCLVVGTCDAVPGMDIVSVQTERDCLLQWTDLIQRENPDIIIGYNIFGFDCEFMFRRAQENRCEREFLVLSRKQDQICAKLFPSKHPHGRDEYRIENQTIALASGEYELKYYNMVGRLQVDMFTYFRREFTNLSSYKLDDVAGQFICDDVKKIQYETDATTGVQTTHLYSSNLLGLHVNDFIHIELSSFTSDYYKDGTKFRVVDILRDVGVLEMVKGVEKTVDYNVIVIAGHEPIPQEKGKHIKWGMAKDDVTPQDIFRLFKGSSADRAVVAKYCVQDCNLVHHLMNKVDVLTGYVEMSRICSVPMSFLVYRGQSIKLTSYVAKKCRDKDTLMPDLDKSSENDGYEGAIVLPPKCSMYIDNPVACVDYSSLYPSSMISNNLSHDSKVWTKEFDLEGKCTRVSGERNARGVFIYDNLPGYEYVDLEFDIFKYVRLTPTAKAKKVKCGTKIVRWAQFPDGRKGIMPSILEELLKARSDTRKTAKNEKDPFMANILDKRQLGYKVTANSLYGQCGAKISSFYEKDVAASTTATGRMMIMYARRMIEEVYQVPFETEGHGLVMTNAEYVYGDSVASYTPVYVCNEYTQVVEVCSISELADKYGGGAWRTCNELGKQTKEVCELAGVLTWSDQGWTKCHRVIRHALAPHKKMMRVVTKSAVVDVTDDHSLLSASGREVSPKDVKMGSLLLHNSIQFTSKQLSTWSNAFDVLLDERMFVSHVNAAKYCLFIQARGYNYSIKTRVLDNQTTIYIVTKTTPLQTAYMTFPELVTRETIIETNTSCTVSDNLFALHMCEDDRFIHDVINGHPVESITPIDDYCDYVYDVTTDNHHFAAGIGSMIVHNTDSVFFTFNLTNPATGQRIRGQDALEITIEIAQHAAKLCSDFLKPPMELSYEKTLMPFILLSKKRYVGMLYETDPHKGKLKYMGLSLKRRDSCDYLKDTYGGILNILMTDSTIQRAIEFLDTSITNLIDGKVPMEKLMITRQLKSSYKNPHQIAHNVLAERIGKRDPGNKPKPGDRMRYVFVCNPGAKLLGDRIETPEQILTQKLKIDYTYYITNQLMKPLQQLLGLAVDKIWEYQNMGGALKMFQKDIDAMNVKYPDLEAFMKQKEKYCSAKIKALLFDKYLHRIYNEKNGIRTLTDMWTIPKKGK